MFKKLFLSCFCMLLFLAYCSDADASWGRRRVVVRQRVVRQRVVVPHFRQQVVVPHFRQQVFVPRSQVLFFNQHHHFGGFAPLGLNGGCY